MDEAPVLTIYTDGASRGNPGAAAFAYVLARDGQPDIEEGGCLGRMTNNQAEYTALVKALKHALELGAEQRLLVHSDSELLVKQMKGEYRVKNEDLRDLYEQARGLVRRFAAPVTFRHVRRHLNSRADALCNEALDGLREPTPRAGQFGIPPAKAKVPQKVSAPPPEALPLRERAVAILRQAADAWRSGAATPTPESVWMDLEKLLQMSGERRGVSPPVAPGGRGTSSR